MRVRPGPPPPCRCGAKTYRKVGPTPQRLPLRCWRCELLVTKCICQP
jgi:hypothetical protein